MPPKSTSQRPASRTEFRLAAAYIRVSTDDQVELSPASQLVEIRKWAASHGYVVPDEFVFADEGISGRKVTGRDEFRRMIGTAKTKPKPFDAILLWKFSRFARNRDDAVMYKSILRKQLGIDVLSISEPMAEGKMGIITEALIEAMDEYYSINLAEEVKRGMEEKHRRGELQSTPAYGYAVKDNILVPQEPEAAYVLQIFHRYAGGEGTYSIARWLNASGQRTHRGNPFENRTVEYILRNPVYLGKLRWNPSGRTRRDFSNPDVVVVDGKHAPLISPELFDTVQKRLDTQKALHKYKGKPAEVQKDWLAGLVRCASCGSTLIFAKPHYWKCNNFVRGSCRTSQHVSDELLKNAILQRLRQDAEEGPAVRFEVIRATDGGASELAAMTSALDSAQRMLDRLRDAYLTGADTLEEYKAGKEAVSQKIADLKQRIAAEQEKTESLAAPQLLRSSIRAALKTLSSNSATMAEKYTAAHSIIDRVTWDKSRNLLQIHYRLAL